MRRVALLLVLTLVVGVGFTASPAVAQKKKSAKITACKKDKNLNSNLEKAFDQFLTGSTTAEKMQYIEDGDKVGTFVEEGAKEAAERGQTNPNTANVTVNLQATCTGKKTAEFTYDLAIGLPKPVTSKPATGVGLNQAGDAVLTKKGQWLITGATICDLIARGNPDRGSRCLNAL